MPETAAAGGLAGLLERPRYKQPSRAKQPIEVVCDQCGKTFLTTYSRKKRCSQECVELYLSRRHTEERSRWRR